MAYADYTYYTQTYLGSAIPEADFPRLALRASVFLDYYTRGKAAADPELDALKMACCAIAEHQQIVDAAAGAQSEASGAGGAVKSESVGSYSVTYLTAAERAEAAASSSEQARKVFAQIAQQYLAGTGMLYRGGCCGCTRRTL